MGGSKDVDWFTRYLAGRGVGVRERLIKAIEVPKLAAGEAREPAP